jgi:hypothetical protein
VDISSAGISSVSFVITATMPARCHQRNEAIQSLSGSELPLLAGKSQIKGNYDSFPSFIATSSQLQ